MTNSSLRAAAPRIIARGPSRLAFAQAPVEVDRWVNRDTPYTEHGRYLGDFASVVTTLPTATAHRTLKGRLGSAVTQAIARVSGLEPGSSVRARFLMRYNSGGVSAWVWTHSGNTSLGTLSGSAYSAYDVTRTVGQDGHFVIGANYPAWIADIEWTITRPGPRWVDPQGEPLRRITETSWRSGDALPRLSHGWPIEGATVIADTGPGSPFSGANNTALSHIYSGASFADTLKLVLPPGTIVNFGGYSKAPSGGISMRVVTATTHNIWSANAPTAWTRFGMTQVLPYSYVVGSDGLWRLQATYNLRLADLVLQIIPPARFSS